MNASKAPCNTTKNSAVFLPEVDGLRALAVTAVVLFHAFPENFPGGFLGVDVFFVLSGFLISRLIMAQNEQGRFSMGQFYLRRAKRLLPVFLVMLVLVWAVAVHLLFPPDLRALAKASFAASLSWSNYYFAENTDYFAVDSELSPLLHTWSLGVEEQFYFIFPALFLYFWRRRICDTRFLRGMAWLVGIGFAVSCLFTRFWMLQGFYGLQSRAWELGIGVLIALLEWNVKSLSERIRSVAAWSGLVLCVGSFFWVTRSSAVPGPVSAFPVVGTALLLWTGAGGRRNPLWKAATIPAIQYLGRLSYTLYLFHWPLLVFQRVDGSYSVWSALALALVLTVIVHHLVENPVRFCSRPHLLRTFGWIGLLLWLSCAGFAKYVRVKRGVINSPSLKWYLRVLPDTGSGVTINKPKNKLGFLGKAGETPEILILGDSHADCLLDAIDAELKARGKAGAYWWSPGLFPGKGVPTSPLSSEFDRTVPIFSQGPWKTVLICCQWRSYLAFDSKQGPVKLQSKVADFEEGFSIVEQGLADTLKALQHKRLILLAPIPNPDRNVANYMAQSLRKGRPFEDSLGTLQDYYNANKAALRLLNSMQKRFELTILDPLPNFIAGSKLRYRDGDLAFYYDDNHLSRRGSRELAPLLVNGL